MKIDSNLGTTFQPENFENSQVGANQGAALSSQTDQLEAFDPTTKSLFENQTPDQFNPDVLNGASLLTGGRSQNFGLLLPAVQFAAPDGSPPASQDDGNWFFDGMSWMSEHLTDASSIVTTPAGWLVDGLMDTSEAMRDGAVWFGEHAWDSLKQLPDALESAGGLLKQGAEGAWDAAQDVWDGSMWVANKMDEGVGTAIHATTEAIQDVSSAVGDAISDALDW